MSTSTVSSGHVGSGWRYLAEGGQAFASPTQHFTEFAGVAVVRDVRLGQRTRLALELFPFLVFNETEKDGRTRERVGASALGTLLSYEIESDRVPWGLRFDAGPGLFYGYKRIPAGGSRFNFFDQLGAFLSIASRGTASPLAIGTSTSRTSASWRPPRTRGSTSIRSSWPSTS